MSNQISLYCPTCQGTGKYVYQQFGRIFQITCPLCKGTRQDTLRGKLPVENSETQNQKAS